MSPPFEISRKIESHARSATFPSLVTSVEEETLLDQPVVSDEEIASARRWFMRQYPDTPGPVNLLTSEERQEYEREHSRLVDSGLCLSQCHASAWRAAIGVDDEQ